MCPHSFHAPNLTRVLWPRDDDIASTHPEACGLHVQNLFAEVQLAFHGVSGTTRLSATSSRTAPQSLHL